MFDYINQTLINTWLMCPERVRRRWVENEIIPPGIAARIGTGLHKGAEVNHKQKMITGADEPKSVITDAARDGYIESLQNGVFFPPDEASTARKQMADGVDATVSLAGLYRDNLAPKINPIGVEHSITMDVDDLPLPFRGILDVEDRDGWVPDLKTAAKKWPESRADSSVQATLYSELYFHEFGQYPRFTFEIFTKTKTPAHQSLEAKRCHDDFLALVEITKSILMSIQAGIFPPADPSHWCCSPKYCGYYMTCRYIPAYRKVLPKNSN